MTNERIAAIKARCDAAKKGPWMAEQLRGGYGVQTKGGWSGDVFGVGFDSDGYAQGATQNDSAFIAEARQDIPDLLDAIEHERNQSATYKKRCEAFERAVKTLNSLGDVYIDPTCQICKHLDEPEDSAICVKRIACFEYDNFELDEARFPEV